MSQSTQREQRQLAKDWLQDLKVIMTYISENIILLIVELAESHRGSIWLFDNVIHHGIRRDLGLGHSMNLSGHHERRVLASLHQNSTLSVNKLIIFKLISSILY
jgi:hypothetical protein